MAESRFYPLLFSIQAAMVLAVVGSSSVGNAQDTPAERFSTDLWTDEINEPAVKHATDLIEKCLTESIDRDVCVATPYATCENEHGTTTLAMADCAEVGRIAWKRLHDENLSRITQMKADGRFGPPAEKVRDLIKSDSTWENWLQRDCQIRLISGGTLRPVIYSRCMASGYAKRAIDLMSFLEDWRH